MFTMTDGDWALQVFTSTVPGAPLIVLVTGAEDVSRVREALADAPAHTLAVLSGFDWERDLSPWAAAGLSKKAPPFAGGADALLRALTERLLPQAEARLAAPPRWRGIAGYSLGGLFALYALYKSTAFSRAASMSGSLWFSGFQEYALTHTLCAQPSHIYLSLGDKEQKTRNLLMQTNPAVTQTLADHYTALGIITTYRHEVGNHFHDTSGRIARGLRWLLEM